MDNSEQAISLFGQRSLRSWQKEWKQKKQDNNFSLEGDEGNPVLIRKSPPPRMKKQKKRPTVTR